MDERGPSHQPQAIAVNSRYAAFADRQGYVVRGLHGGSRDVYDLPSESQRTEYRTNPSLALSEVRPSRLAVSAGTQIVVHDVDAGRVEFVFHGTGRSVTCLSWSRHHADMIAVGMVDGSICIWTKRNLIRPLHRFQSGSGPCTHIAFSRVDKTVLASSLDDQVAVWSLNNPRRPLWSRDKGSAKIFTMDWSPAGTGKLLVASFDNIVRIWDVMHDLSDVREEPMDDDSDDENYGVFGELDDAVSSTPAIIQLQFDQLPAHVEWVGTTGIFTFLNSQHEVVFYGSTDIASLAEIWRLELDSRISAITFQCPDGKDAFISAIGWDHCQTHRLPSDIREPLGWHTKPTSLQINEAEDSDHTNVNGQDSFTNTNSQVSDALMKLITIREIHSQESSFTKTSRQLQNRHLNIKIDPAELERTSKAESKTHAESHVSNAMTSSLELPTPNADDETAMPFLSPSIPARGTLTNPLLPLDEIIDLPPLEHTSSRSTLATGVDDSDSDDDTFNEGLRGSGTFMPGGLNVPLPRACGALFAPNGQLVVFIPPKIRPASAIIDEMDGVEPDTNQGQFSIARLFPTFGNLAGDASVVNDDSSDAGSSSSEDNTKSFAVPQFALDPSSYHSQQSWKFKFSPADPGFKDLERQQSITVSVKDINSLIGGSRDAAERYRVLCSDEESAVDLCYHNCKVAREFGLFEAASVWSLIAMTLEDRVPLDLLTMANNVEDVVVVARKVSSVFRNSFNLRDSTGDNDRHGKLRWADHPFGAQWIARKSLQWAENRADVQMLASLSAVFAETRKEMMPRERSSFQSSGNLSKTDYFSYFEPPRTAQAMLIPILRNSSKPVTPSNETPPKPRISRNSSRNASRSTTPFFDSARSTPPLVLPALSRTSTRLSASGSASPEQSRSSFSAAAKYYAQSITDKFAAYGTSPPTKKLSASPSVNELSTSLPMASGSWSKSVSFASNVDPPKASQLSTSYTTHDDDYDSDRTIDENSLPPTPKSPLLADVSVKMKARDDFADNVTGGTKACLLPVDLVKSSLLWRNCFAEQLRAWCLFDQATELEKTTGTYNQDLVLPPPWDGITPSNRGRRRPTCSICYVAINGLRQLCPVCHHVTHVECMENFLLSLDDEKFSCPSGCGCLCDQLPFQPIEISPVPEPKPEPLRHETSKTIKKKASFTDPRFWGDRLEKNSW